MKNYQRALCENLSGSEPALNSLSSSELGDFFVGNAFLTSALEFLRDEQWLQKKLTTSFEDFIAEAFAVELAPIHFLQGFIAGKTPQALKTLQEFSHKLESSVITHVKNLEAADQKIFSATVFSLMAQHFHKEYQRQQMKTQHGLGLGLTLYRTFDGMDEIFGLRYEADAGMKATSAERLYEGAGIGVQSSYSTLLNALREINPSHGAKFIDLGSGYGRAGLVVGLLRPDIDFTGYEYVPHRVNIANASVKNLDMQKHVHFFAQDLSALDFKIPEADIYYMYDPFSKETYKYVLDQLQEIGHHRKITIATKGNARDWMMAFQNSKHWEPIQEMDGGNLCLYRSR